ncbi:MAG: hypothetical protein KKC19_04365 [Nanoarchaeota archaeon]|nr:hypothetical protein [Nanoarchaeota archaeon]
MTLAQSHIYYGEKCKGMVTARFSVHGKKVIGYFDDGDISSFTIEYELSREPVTGEYFMKEETRDSLSGRSVDRIELHSSDKNEAMSGMIKEIVEPYKDKGPGSWPVSIRKLKKGLEEALLTDNSK